MYSFSLTATAAAAALLAVADATIPQELLDRKLPDCDSNGFDGIQDKGTFWYNTGAEQFADDFISSHANSDHTNWAQELYHDLFPDTTKSDYDCTDPDSDCVYAKDCGAYNAQGKGGLFYLFKSLQNFHTYMAALKLKMLESAFTSGTQVGVIRQILSLPDGKAEEPINFFALLSGAASIGSVAASNPAYSGGLSALSGVFGLLNEAMPKPEDTPDMNDQAQAAIESMVGQAVKKSREEIIKINAAVFGKFGHLQTDIPEVMRRADVKNPAVSVLGWGDWLKDNGLSGLQDMISNMNPKIDQALLWQMARLYKRTYVVVRSDLDVNECTNPNNAWDAEKSRCLDLLSWSGSVDGTLGGANDLNDMWGKWNMDPFTTMRNAVDCWENNNGNIGPVVIDRNWADSTPPVCFFAMTVLKGSYSDIQKGTLWLDGDFAGQSGMDGKLWPKNKCDSALEQGDEECEYEWKDGTESE